MATVHIVPKKLAAANRWANLLRTAAERDYAFAYIAWLRNGAEGLEPERGALGLRASHTLKAIIDGMRLWEGAKP